LLWRVRLWVDWCGDRAPGSVTHKKLAKIIGTTPSKIVFFMNKFRKQGLIDYKGDGDVKVMPELLTDMILRA